jgi:hypothetical protein
MSINRSQTEKIGSIFNGNRFVIPKYQCKYSWTDIKQKALWEDIKESIKDNMPHFLGILSFKKNRVEGLSADIIYEIIDGQQRITTLFILLKVIIKKLEDENVQKSQMSAFIGEETNLKLQPLGEDGVFLNKLLFHFKDIMVDDIVKRSQKHMYMAKKNFLAFANSLDQKQIEEKIIFIRDWLEVLVFNVASQAQTVTMIYLYSRTGSAYWGVLKRIRFLHIIIFQPDICFRRFGIIGIVRMRFFQNLKCAAKN